MDLGFTSSPKMSWKTKDLYMTKNHTLEELHKIVDSKSNITNIKNNPMLLFEIGDKLHDEGIKAGNNGDEERAFVMLMRFLECTNKIQKSEEYKLNPAIYKKMLEHKRIDEAIALCETLSDRLKDRYMMITKAKEIDSDLKKPEVTDTLADENEKSIESKDFKKLAAISKNNVFLCSNGVVKPKIKDEAAKYSVLPILGVITVKYLKTLVEQKARFLAIDCRSKHDFTRGFIAHSNCINIPPEILQPGITANQLEKKIKEVHPESYKNWSKRDTFEQIVLYDWNSSYENQQPPLSYLFEAMTWDPETRYKAPAVLQGGVKNLYYLYPALITKPQNGSEDAKKVESVALKMEKKLDSITYLSCGDEDFTGSSKSSSPEINNDLSSNGFNEKNSMSDNSFHGHYTPTIDRSTKPKSSMNDISNGPVKPNQDNISTPSGGMVNTMGSAKSIKVEEKRLKKEVINTAIEKQLTDELPSKACSACPNKQHATQVKNVENEVEELKKELQDKEFNYIILEQEYNAMVERNRILIVIISCLIAILVSLWFGWFGF